MHAFLVLSYLVTSWLPLDIFKRNTPKHKFYMYKLRVREIIRENEPKLNAVFREPTNCSCSEYISPVFHIKSFKFVWSPHPWIFNLMYVLIGMFSTLHLLSSSLKWEKKNKSNIIILQFWTDNKNINMYETSLHIFGGFVGVRLIPSIYFNDLWIIEVNDSRDTNK